MKRLDLKLLALLALLAPKAAYAQLSCPAGYTTTNGVCLPGGSGTGLLGARTIPELVISVLNIAIFFAGLVAVIFVVIGGYRYIVSGAAGDTGDAKKTIINALIGLAVVLLAFAIVRVVANTVIGVV